MKDKNTFYLQVVNTNVIIKTKEEKIMGQETEEKFGKIVHNGRIIDLDSLDAEEREALIDEMETYCEKLSDEIDKILHVDE